VFFLLIEREVAMPIAGAPRFSQKLLERALRWPLSAVLVLMGAIHAVTAGAQVRPGDLIRSVNAGEVAGLLSPGNQFLVKQGMEMDIMPTTRIEGPPPYKEATEKYSPQVSLAPDGTLRD
jgi:hypothetical protein